MKRAFHLVLLLAFSLFLALLIVFLLHRSPRTVVSEWEKPASVEYESARRYYLSVLREDWDWSSFPYHVARNYSIYVGRESGKPTYGHVVKHSFHPTAPHYNDVEGHIKASKVEWTPEGVTFIEASGHRLFIPKAMFTGGR